MRTIIALSANIAFVFAGYATAAEPISAPARTEACKATTEQEIPALFDRWNLSLQTGDPNKVVANYAARFISASYCFK